MGVTDLPGRPMQQMWVELEVEKSGRDPLVRLPQLPVTHGAQHQIDARHHTRHASLSIDLQHRRITGYYHVYKAE
jgi:hypothetical protein